MLTGDLRTRLTYYKSGILPAEAVKQLDELSVRAFRDNDVQAMCLLQVKLQLLDSGDTWVRQTPTFPMGITGVSYFDGYVSDETGTNEARLARLIHERGVVFKRNFDFTVRGNLTDEQVQAVKIALTNNLSFITGGPGTGKTTAVQAILDSLDVDGRSYLMLAPTGRAANRMTAVTGRPAYTIHKALGYDGTRFNVSKLTDVEFVIVDESSMVYNELGFQLLRALESTTPIVFIGDADQLPPVQPGSFFHELVTCGFVPGTRLTHIHRFEVDGPIGEAARAVLMGQVPKDAIRGKNGFHFVPVAHPFSAVGRQGGTRMPFLPASVLAAKAFAKSERVQVLSPVYDGPFGITEINRLMRTHFNPRGTLADPVICTKNQYDINVYNGDVGEKRGDLFKFPNMDWSLFRPGTWEYAYAISVHKAQGDQYPAVIVSIPSTHSRMSRNLVYTALTRAEALCCMFGSPERLKEAVERTPRPRMSFLGRFLRDGAPKTDTIQVL